MPTATAYSYLRFSSPAQAHGDSTRRQTELRDAWLARNKVKLDESVRLEDRGVSGFHGKHRKNPDRHALAEFLGLVERGRIAKGSYLIVENLDRLSREDIVPALSLVLRLIEAGIRIVQLIPVETVYHGRTDPMQLMMAIMELARGHSESAMKSERLGAAWRNKKQLAAKDRKILTAQAPAWLRLEDGRWVKDAKAVAAVRLVLKWAREGYGLTALTKRLQADGVPPIGKGKKWARSYVAKLIKDKRVLGEYQPMTGRGKERVKDGEPIPGYYPAIVTEKDWHAARAGAEQRKNKVGRMAKGTVNVFAGLLRDAVNECPLQLANKGKRSSGRMLVPGKPDVRQYGAFPFAVFEQAILGFLREVDARDILPQGANDSADETPALIGRLAELDADIEKMKARLQGRYSEAVADVLERQETERATVRQELDKARQRDVTPLGQAWKECRSLLDVLDGDDARIRLRSLLRRTVEGVYCVFVRNGVTRLAAVQVWFPGGMSRDYFVAYRSPLGGAVGVRPAQWYASSAVDWGTGDLRDLDEALLARSTLEAYPPAFLDRLLAQT